MPDLLYAILRHDKIEHPHFDLMFQTAPGSLLATFRAQVWRPTEAVLLERLPDHRQTYLTFEGEIAGARGRVTRVEQGLCQVDQSESSWTIKLHPLPAGEHLILHVTKEKHAIWRCTTMP